MVLQREFTHLRNIQGKPGLVLPNLGTFFPVYGCFRHWQASLGLSLSLLCNAKCWQTHFQVAMNEDEMILETKRQKGWRMGADR